MKYLNKEIQLQHRFLIQTCEKVLTNYEKYFTNKHLYNLGVLNEFFEGLTSLQINLEKLNVICKDKKSEKYIKVLFDRIERNKILIERYLKLNAFI